MLVKLAFTIIILAVLTVSVRAAQFFNNVNASSAKSCDSDSPWLLKSYDSLKIPARGSNSYCFISNVNSCVDLSPISFIPGNVEAMVYFDVYSNKSNIIITVFNDNDVPIVSSEYNRLSEEYFNGWKRLLLNIDHNFAGYIKLQSTCAKGDIILVDSIYNNPKDIVEKLDSPLKDLYIRKLEPEVELEAELKRDVQSKSKLKNYLELQSYPGSPLDSTTKVEVTNLDPKSDGTLQLRPISLESTKQQEFELGDEDLSPVPYFKSESDTLQRQNNTSSDFWNPWTISLVCIGALVIMSITGIASYHLGKMRGQKKADVFIIEEETDPQRIIPRVTKVHSNPSFLTM